ncbi:HAD family hydrolase [Desulfurococcaceae archaeon MEX13E-LK6-19]|nr:HAD family hydrolase [Desulfurococcaceae archaeon MEX13E-LK6-19]
MGNDIVFVYDFDGVIVDSYDCLPKVYREIARLLNIENTELFVKAMIMFEDVADYMGLWDRRKWWKIIFSIDDEKAEEISRLYWGLRIKYTKVFDDAKTVLTELKKRGYVLYMVTGCDDTIENKIKRIEASGVKDFFEEILVYGRNSNYKDIVQAINVLKKKLSDKTLYYVDDKPSNLRKLVGLNIRLVHYMYKPHVFPEALSWTEKTPDGVIEIKDHREILNII